jgi:hypothetical protein
LELTMTDFQNLAEENERHRAHIIETFGPDAVAGLEPFEPTTGKTALKLAGPSLTLTRDRQRQEDLELVQVAAQEQEEDEALDMAIRKMRKGGGKLPPGTMRRAARALERRGYHQGTTAERLARMPGRGQGWRPAS